MRVVTYSAKYKAVDMVKETSHNYDVSFRTPYDVWNAINMICDVASLPEEHVWLIAADSKSHMRGIVEMSTGNANTCIFPVREIIRDMLLLDAVTFFVVHNHPSGDTTPSDEDINITKKLKEASDIVGVKMLDHVIVSHDDYTSLINAV